MSEIQTKLREIREILKSHQLGGVRLRGVDWFSWATGGGSSVVIFTTETGIAEVFITEKGAWVLTNAIEKERLRLEEVPSEFEIFECPWADAERLEEFVRDQAPKGAIASDRPVRTEVPLPEKLVAAKRRLLPEEIERYRALGREASEAMTETLRKARPEWTEFELAGHGAQALWARGIHPTLVLVGGESRVSRFRHPFPSAAPLGQRAMMVFCARRGGLYANLTRFVYFRQPTDEERSLALDAARVESAAFAVSVPGATLDQVFEKMVSEYSRLGHSGEHLKHHQGGTTGYLSREVVAGPKIRTSIEANTALAWNPSLPGAKIEDTVLATAYGLEILTRDPNWPSFTLDGCERPDLLVRD